MSRLEFAKSGKAACISHLDLMRTMSRSFLRAGFLLRHSEGFNPHASISVALPLPLGHESDCELMDFKLKEAVASDEIVVRLNRVLPEGLTALRVTESSRPFREIEYLRHRVELKYDGGTPAGAADTLTELFGSDDITVYRKTKKSEGDFNIAPCIKEKSFSPLPDGIRCEAVLTAMRPMLSPLYLIAAVERYAPALSPSFVRYRRIEILDGSMRRFE